MIALPPLIVEEAHFHVQIKQFCKSNAHLWRFLEWNYDWYEQDQKVTGRTEIDFLWFGEYG